jgi:acyl-CoA hydrolase
LHGGDGAGAVVDLVARVIGTGRTSLQVEVEMLREDLLSGEAQLATRGHFTMVALDVQGRPTPVSPLSSCPPGVRQRATRCAPATDRS